MMPKIKTIIIVVVAVIIIFLVYLYFTRPADNQANLVSSSSTTTLPNIDGTTASTSAGDTTSFVAKDFLALLLNVRNIKLDDSILSDPAFTSLKDSSIILTQDGTEGRPNPFAQFGNDTPPAAPDNGAVPDAGGATPPVLPDVPATPPVTPPANPKTSGAKTHFTDKLNISGISPTSAKIGAKITVTGVGFAKTGNSFYFYFPDTNESASVKDLSSSDGTKLTVTIPASLTAHKYSTYVINSGGASNSVEFTVTP
jgi:hypothetical protein